MHHDDFKFEPVRGLPEALPKGEHILWQGSPHPMRLAKEALKLNWVLFYFVLLAIGRVVLSLEEFPLVDALAHGLPFLVAGAIAAMILYAIATVQARSTVYTLTNKRAAMRIGAALTMTLNLPYVCIGNAHAATRKGGSGTLAFELNTEDRISHIMTWPHVRPWALAKTQPAFRAIPNVQKVAAIFADAAEARVSEPKITRVDGPQGATGTVAAE